MSESSKLQPAKAPAQAAAEQANSGGMTASCKAYVIICTCALRHTTMTRTGSGCGTYFPAVPIIGHLVAATPCQCCRRKMCHGAQLMSSLQPCSCHSTWHVQHCCSWIADISPSHWRLVLCRDRAICGSDPIQQIPPGACGLPIPHHADPHPHAHMQRAVRNAHSWWPAHRYPGATTEFGCKAVRLSAPSTTHVECCCSLLCIASLLVLCFFL